MIELSAFQTVSKKLSEGKQKWITITGNAGDGKTTLGYMVLNALQREKENVFIINSPEEFHQLITSMKKCTVMLNDRFGDFNFDTSSPSKWATHIKYCFDDYDKSVTSEGQIRVLFISRKNVLLSAKPQLEGYGDKILDSECVVDLSVFRHEDDRRKLLDHYLDDSVSDKKKQQVVNINTPHGFPHCCKMYKDIKCTKGMTSIDIDLVEFFTHPLLFLDKTTRGLAHRKECEELFKHMIKSDGMLNAYDITDTDINKAVMELDGSYIRKTNRIISFTHPSIFESVVSVFVEMAEANKMWIIKNMSLSAIRQMVNIKGHGAVPGTVNIDPHPEILDVLCERFRTELLRKDFSVFKHTFCQNKGFCERLVQNCVQEMNSPDKRSTFQSQSEIVNLHKAKQHLIVLMLLEGGFFITGIGYDFRVHLDDVTYVSKCRRGR